MALMTVPCMDNSPLSDLTSLLLIFDHISVLNDFSKAKNTVVHLKKTFVSLNLYSIVVLELRLFMLYLQTVYKTCNCPNFLLPATTISYNEKKIPYLY